VLGYRWEIGFGFAVIAFPVFRFPISNISFLRLSTCEHKKCLSANNYPMAPEFSCPSLSAVLSLSAP